MSSFTSVPSSYPSLLPLPAPQSPLLSLLHSLSLIPSTVCTPPHPHPPNYSTHPTAYFCLSCPHCKVECYQRRESKEGPGSVSVIVIFNVINFNFQSSGLLCLLLSPPPTPSHPLLLPIMGICQFCLSLSFPLIHSDCLSPNTYWLLSCLMCSPTSATQNAIFPRPHL